MTIREAAWAELKKLKGKPLKDKLIHIGTYYWPYLLACGFVLIFAVSLIVTLAGAKEPALQGYFLGALPAEDAPDPQLRFAQFAGLDPEVHDITLTASPYAISGSTDMAMADAQIIASHTASEALDILGGDMQLLIQYAYDDYFYDLRQLLTPAQLQAWESQLLYIDLAVQKTIREGSRTVFSLPDPTAPELMAEPVPVVLALPASGTLCGCYVFDGELPAVGVIINTRQPENALRFLEFAME